MSLASPLSGIALPGPTLSPRDEEIFRRQFTAINVANEARRTLNVAEMSLVPFMVIQALGEAETKEKRRRINRTAVLEVLKKHPHFVEDAYAALFEPAIHLGISPKQFHACVAGIKRSLKSGLQPGNRLRDLIHDKWRQAERGLANLPPSFKKTVLGAYIALRYNPGHVDYLQEFRSYFGTTPPADIAAIVEFLATYPITDVLERRRYAENWQSYSAYEIVREIAPTSNAEFLADLEDQISVDLSEWVTGWRSFLDNSISRRIASGPRHFYFGPTPSTRDGALHLYQLCSNRFLRGRFRTTLLELCQLASRMQEGNGAWSGAFSLSTSEKRDITVRDDCTFSTIFMVLALHEVAESVDYTKNIEKAVTWLVKVQQKDGSFEDTNSNYNNSACLTILASVILSKFGEGAEGSIARAHSYLLSKQNAFGFWDGSPPLGEFQITTCALRYLLGRLKKLGSEPGHWGQSALRFLSIAEDVLTRGDVTAAKLAVVATYHAVEFALYEVISRFANGNIYANDTSDRTLGVREAKAKLRELARETGILEAKKELPYSMQISQHASLRDNVVHRNQDVDQPSAQRTVEVSKRFIETILTYRP